jgi:tRNA threonylcarbamoyladenosine biosynthesis protein TsaB
MLLAIDSSTRTLSLALHDGDQILAESTWNTSNRHTVELSPAIQHLLAQVNLQPSSLSLLAVAQGPGSFNGLRIGFSVAKGLAMALNLPLLTIPTLDIVAAAQLPFDGLLVAVAQAGRGRVCAGSYRWSDEMWRSQNDVQIVSWQKLLEIFAGTSILISGEIDEPARGILSAFMQDSPDQVRIANPTFLLRRAGFLAELAWKRWREGDPGDPLAAVPFYLHQPGVPHP